ncbi:hypothetical protein NPS29_12515 [Pseudomonas putida]|uniref:hypothetical protein n=1 Tax=Pseudomonas putida TaxID=303 RepID=UPI00236465A2|nr:hypothetical protein [Pseudomonas putida]MDD1966144.1 hypothetical protein [Pseudomonas putida]
MAMDQKQRDEKAAAKRKKLAEKELRHRVRPGIEQALSRVRKRGSTPVASEVLQIAIMKMDLMSDEELIDFLKYPRHEIMISEEVARVFTNASLKAIQADPGDEIIAPA